MWPSDQHIHKILPFLVRPFLFCKSQIMTSIPFQTCVVLRGRVGGVEQGGLSQAWWSLWASGSQAGGGRQRQWWGSVGTHHLLSWQGQVWCILTFHGNSIQSFSTSSSFYGEEREQRWEKIIHQVSEFQERERRVERGEGEERRGWGREKWRKSEGKWGGGKGREREGEEVNRIEGEVGVREGKSEDGVGDTVNQKLLFLVSRRCC